MVGEYESIVGIHIVGPGLGSGLGCIKYPPLS